MHPRDMLPPQAWGGKGELAGLLGPLPSLAELPAQYAYVPIEDEFGNVLWMVAGEVDQQGITQPITDWGVMLSSVAFFQVKGSPDLAAFPTWNDRLGNVGYDRHAGKLLDIVAGAVRKARGWTYTDEEAYTYAYRLGAGNGSWLPSIVDDSGALTKGKTPGSQLLVQVPDIHAPVDYTRVAHVLDVPATFPPFPGFWESGPGFGWYLRVDAATRLCVPFQISSEDVFTQAFQTKYLRYDLVTKIRNAAQGQVMDAVAAGFEIVVGVVLVVAGQEAGVGNVANGIKRAVAADQAFDGINAEIGAVAKALARRIATYRDGFVALALRGRYKPGQGRVGGGGEQADGTFRGKGRARYPGQQPWDPPVVSGDAPEFAAPPPPPQHWGMDGIPGTADDPAPAPTPPAPSARSSSLGKLAFAALGLYILTRGDS